VLVNGSFPSLTGTQVGLNVIDGMIYAQPLYERAGYRPRGRVFVEAGIEHIAMEKRL